MIKKVINGGYLNINELNNLNFKKIGKNVFIDKNVIIPNPSNIEIGNNVRIDTNCILSSGKSGKIIIKNNIHIAPFNLIYCADNYKVIFENHTGLSAGCKLYGKTANYDGNNLMNPTHNSEDIEYINGDIILNKFSSIGCDTVLLPGSIIPIGTVLGAKSLYTAKDKLNEWSIYAGSPIKFIKIRNNNCELLSIKYNI
uniref:Acetyltransferase n=1 Tax=viral metagenome TaxID=1070528 RepID=A0A6C0JIX7_9ZZZZ